MATFSGAGGGGSAYSRLSTRYRSSRKCSGVHVMLEIMLGLPAC